MRRIAILSILWLTVVYFCCHALASSPSFAWETHKMPYSLKLQGIICWTGVREYKSNGLKEPVLHTMDLSTGVIQTQPRDGWYLIQTDYHTNGTLLARQTNGKIQIAQWTRDGSWKPLLEYPFVNTYKQFGAGAAINYDDAVIAYMNGYLYYRSSDSGETHLHRDDLRGNTYTYSLANTTGPISPRGNLASWNDEGILCIEEVDGKVEIIPHSGYYSLRPFVWLDDGQLLLWVQTEKEAVKTLYLYECNTQSLDPYKTTNGDMIYYEYGSEGFSASVDPSNGNILQMVLCGEGFYNVPTILDLTTGKPVFVSETEHTEVYDEFCEHDIAVWLIPSIP